MLSSNKSVTKVAEKLPSRVEISKKAEADITNVYYLKVTIFTILLFKAQTLCRHLLSLVTFIIITKSF